MNDCLNKASIKYGEQDTGTQDFLKGLQPTTIFRGFQRPIRQQTPMESSFHVG
jgi:hypothetical protein